MIDEDKLREIAREWLKTVDPRSYDGRITDLAFDFYRCGFRDGLKYASDGEGVKSD